MKLLIATISLMTLSIYVLGNTYYLDPVDGDITNSGSINEPWPSLSEVINANYIRSKQYSNLPYTGNNPLIDKNLNGKVNPGDTLILRGGLHGRMFLRNYINDAPILVKGYQDEIAILESVQLQACKNWYFDHISISTEPYGFYLSNRLFFIESHGWQGPSSHVTVENCEIFSTAEPWTTAQEWLDNSSSGLFIQADSCRAINNRIYNIDMGLTCLGDYITAEGNQIINFSGDGGRVLGSHISFNYNLIKNNYNVDDNHDDGIQSFTTNGYVVDDNELIGNLIINSDKGEHPLSGPLQGIGCFDGFYNDWLIANNVISVNHWHGISLLGARRCTIIHNTVIDPTPTITPGGSWIRIDDHKDGTPSEECLVSNNVANKFVVNGNEINNVIVNSINVYGEHFIDYSIFDFKLRSTSTLIDRADLSFTIPYDHENNQRDNLPDIGAFEYTESPNSIVAISDENSKVIFPNPFYDNISVSNLTANDKIYCYDINGKLIASGNVKTINSRLRLASSGIYNLIVINEISKKYFTSLIFKY